MSKRKRTKCSEKVRDKRTKRRRTCAAPVMKDGLCVFHWRQRERQLAEQKTDVETRMAGPTKRTEELRETLFLRDALDWAKRREATIHFQNGTVSVKWHIVYAGVSLAGVLEADGPDLLGVLQAAAKKHEKKTRAIIKEMEDALK